MKRILAIFALLPALAFGQSYPSPQFSLISIGGTPHLSAMQSVYGQTYQASTNTQPATDYYHNLIFDTVTYTGAGSNGDSIALNSAMQVFANGQTITGSNTQHITGLYGNSFLGNDGNAAGSIAFVNGVMGNSGNNGVGTVVTGRDIVSHTDYNTAGGAFTNHWAFYQETSTAAAHEYGAFFSAPVSIGQSAPTYELEILGGATANLSGSNWAKIGNGIGTIFMQNNGMCIYPAGCSGAGSFASQAIAIGTTFITPSAGELAMSKITATGIAPGANGAKLEVVCGTTAGSVKLIMYGGTSTTPVTIIDNVGTGVTGC